MRGYLYVLSKRLLRLAPAAVCVGIVLVLCVSIAVGSLIEGELKESAAKINLGVCGDLDNRYVRLALFAVDNFDFMNSYVNVEMMEREEGERRLDSGELDGLVIVPDGFVSSVIQRNPLAVRFVVKESPTNLQSAVFGEIAERIEAFVRQTQSGIYGAQDYAFSQGVGDLEPLTDAIVDNYVALIISRDNMFENIPVKTNGVGLTGYYYRAVVTLVGLLWGMACFGALYREKRGVERQLLSKGTGCVSQMLCEYAAHFLFTLAFFILCVFISSLILPASVAPPVSLYYSLLPFCLLISALHLAFYEAFKDALGAVLSQFLFALFFGFLSGLFYPSNFFAPAVERVFSLLPVGAAFGVLRSGPGDENRFFAILLCLLWAALAFFAAAAIRGVRLRGEKL